jgi:hypothetical protein
LPAHAAGKFEVISVHAVKSENRIPKSEENPNPAKRQFPGAGFLYSFGFRISFLLIRSTLPSSARSNKSSTVSPTIKDSHIAASSACKHDLLTVQYWPEA